MASAVSSSSERSTSYVQDTINRFIEAVNKEANYDVVTGIWEESMRTTADGRRTRIVPTYINADALRRINKGNSYISVLAQYFIESGSPHLAEVLVPRPGKSELFKGLSETAAASLRRIQPPAPSET